MNTADFDQNACALETIDQAELSDTTGGDFATGWWKTVHKDLVDTGTREHNVVSAVKQHHWATAAKQAVAAGVNDLHTIADAVNPLKFF